MFFAIKSTTFFTGVFFDTVVRLNMHAKVAHLAEGSIAVVESATKWFLFGVRHHVAVEFRDAMDDFIARFIFVFIFVVTFENFMLLF